MIIDVFVLPEALVMIVDRDRENLLGVFLSDYEIVKVGEQFGWSWDSILENAGDLFGLFLLST